MITLGWLIFVSGALVGIVGTRAWYSSHKGLLQAVHKRQMDEIFEEVRRARAQVADLIGKEDE